MVEGAAADAKPGEWIVGRGWHQAKWQQPPNPSFSGYPTHDRLSAATPRHPVVLTHASGHMCFANQRAMELANVMANTRAPSGGVQHRIGGTHSRQKRPVGHQVLSKPALRCLKAEVP